MYPRTISGRLFFSVRVLLAAIWFFSGSLVLFIIACFLPPDGLTGYYFTCFVAPPILWILGIRVEIRNPERAKTSVPCVYIGNHQQLLDVFIYAYGLPKGTVTVGKKSIRWVPLFGWFYWRSGQIMIDRKDNFSSVRSLSEGAQKLKRKRLSLLVFPEGTRSRGQGIGRFKKGAFRFAMETGYSLHPITVSDFQKCLNLGRLHAGTVVFDLLEPIPTLGRTVDDLVEESRAKIVGAFTR